MPHDTSFAPRRAGATSFRDVVSDDGTTPYAAEPGRYHLYVSPSCPYARMTVMARRRNGLEEAVGMSVVDPVRSHRGWAFTGGAFVDAVNGWRYLDEAYALSDPAYRGRVTVPVLWDTVTRTIVNNESADIVRMFDRGFGGLADGAAGTRRTAAA